MHLVAVLRVFYATNCQLFLGVHDLIYYDVGMTHKSIKSKKSSGFTLVELMIVVAIIGILASIAYPSYTRYVQKSKRTEAMVALMQAAQIQEKYYSQNLKYAYNPATLFSDNTLGATYDTENGLYKIYVYGYKTGYANSDRCTLATDTCVNYQLIAQAKSTGSQFHDLTCRKFYLRNNGEKSSRYVTALNGSEVSNTAGTCW